MVGATGEVAISDEDWGDDPTDVDPPGVVAVVLFGTSGPGLLPEMGFVMTDSVPGGQQTKLRVQRIL